MSNYLVNCEPKLRDRRQLIWPAAGFLFAVIATLLPGKTALPPGLGAAICSVAMAAVLYLSATRLGARIAALLAGCLMAAPCWINAEPLACGLLAGGMAAALLTAAAFVVRPPIPGVRNRVAHLVTWCGTREVSRRRRTFDGGNFQRLILATVILVGAIAAVKGVSIYHLWLPLRWLAGGIVLFAFAEMATAGIPFVASAFGLNIPALFDSPYLSRSISEFWTRRWNIGASQLIFRRGCFEPLARKSVPLAVLTTFSVSAIIHFLLAYFVLGRWRPALTCGLFFLVQPLLIAGERALKVRRWRSAAARLWTLSALALTSPLFVEPAMQFLEQSWGTMSDLLLPPLLALVSIIVFSMALAGASLAVPSQHC